jgi:uncharacterized membrane protein/nitrite reductase/ring-hydroxylating ferredoxin subunit
MRSKANFRGHPSHPALIPFPFGFLIGALIFNVLGVWFDEPSFWTTGAHLAVAGVIAGVIAAVPGAIDYFYTVPPRSSGKRRATRHAVVNVSALLLFALSRWLRGEAAAEPGITLLGLEAVGAGLLTAGGWMGGTLVSRNQISVDHRYANAGKWSEETLRPPRRGEPLKVTPGEFGIDQMRLLRVGSARIVLGRTEEGFVAFEDRCTHRGGSLAGGVMLCGTVQCPWHGSQFDVATGAVEAGPAKKPIRAYRVEETDDGALEIHGLPAD